MRRGQTEPLAALVAAFAVAVGLGLYADALAGAADRTERDAAEPTLERVHDAASVRGVVRPDRVAAAVGVGPTGYALNVTARIDGRRWCAGPTPPSDGSADAAARPVSVRVDPGRTRPGTLRAVVWR